MIEGSKPTRLLIALPCLSPPCFGCEGPWGAYGVGLPQPQARPWHPGSPLAPRLTALLVAKGRPPVSRVSSQSREQVVQSQCKMLSAAGVPVLSCIWQFPPCFWGLVSGENLACAGWHGNSCHVCSQPAGALVSSPRGALAGHLSRAASSVGRGVALCLLLLCLLGGVGHPDPRRLC